MNPFVPTIRNFTRKTKFVNDCAVQINSLWGTRAASEPPTRAPFSIRQVLLVSPSQPRNVFPSNSAIGPLPALELAQPLTRVAATTRDRSIFILSVDAGQEYRRTHARKDFFLVRDRVC